MKMRDKTIDHLRGFAMLWVIVVHVLYWGNFFSNENINLFKSFCLFEMPLFFFVTGASNSFSQGERYIKYVFKRYKRVLIPYWVFAIICAILSIADFGITNGMDISTAIYVFVSWLVPVDRQMTAIPYLTWALWFVPVYLCVILLIPLLKQIRGSSRSGVFLLALSALFVITSLYNLGWIQNVVFYSLWTYVGLFYSDIVSWLKQSGFRKQLGLIALVGIAALFIFYRLGQPIDMQYNKFPPNLMFGIFSVVMMSFVLLSIPCINTIAERIGKNALISKVFDLFSTRSMTIFLYQVFAFSLTIRLVNILVPEGGMVISVVKSILCLITTVPVCAVFAMIFGGVENIGVKRKIETDKLESTNNKNICCDR